MLKVTRNLLRERTSIRDLRTILEMLAEIGPAAKDSEQLTAITRQRLARQITSAYMGPDGALDPEEVRRVGMGMERA